MSTSPTLRPVSEIDTRLIFRTIHGYRRAVRIAGDGPPLLLIHGISDNSETWSDVIPHFAASHRVIAPDLLGHGRSDKPRADYSVAAYANGLRDLLTVLGVERATIVGHSLGGGVAMQFAYQFPHLVERLVLVGTAGIRADVHPVFRLASLPGVASVLQLLQLPGATPLLGLLGRQAAALYTATGASSASIMHDAVDALRVLQGQSDVMGHRAFVKTLRAGADWRGQTITILDRCYLTEHVPVQIVWGARDAVIPVSHARLAHAAMPGSRLEIFDDAAHFPFRDDPLRFVRLVEQFIDSTQPAVFDESVWRESLAEGFAVAQVTGGPAARMAVLNALGSAERSAT